MRRMLPRHRDLVADLLRGKGLRTETLTFLITNYGITGSVKKHLEALHRHNTEMARQKDNLQKVAMEPV